jgi:serine/threonine protein kinase
METTRSSQVKDPASLPAGTEVAEWRVVSWAGRGAYGTVYRVERLGRENEGPYALKMALRPRDERFERETELLSRIDHPNVPRLEGRGVWQHPAGHFPYLVMQWVPGETLYEWAARRNPTSRQMLRLMAQVARAIAAAAKAGGLHRDVKGDNVLVRVADEHAFLIDFGAGAYKGAETLTVQPLPPGTPNYRTYEAWSFQRTFAAHPSMHYPSSVCDELFALGVTAYRLVTDEYPPCTEPDQPGAEVWRKGGSGPRPPRELNANVSEELSRIILRLLASPERRFKGDALLAAETMEHAAASGGAEEDAHLFEWETVSPADWTREERRHAELHGHRLRRRDKATVQRSEQEDAKAKAEAARVKRQEQEQIRAEPEPEPAPSRDRGTQLLMLFISAMGGSLLMTGTCGTDEPEQLHEEPAVARAKARDADGGTAGAAEEALMARSEDPVVRRSLGRVAMPMPQKPLPGQRKPPCNQRGEVELRGGCWFFLSLKPPCETKAAGNVVFYEWDDSCYLPSYSQQRQPTSDPP